MSFEYCTKSSTATLLELLWLPQTTRKSRFKLLKRGKGLFCKVPIATMAMKLPK